MKKLFAFMIAVLLATPAWSMNEEEAAEAALKTGDTAPEFSLLSPMAKEVALSELLEDGPVILTWYRGGWCPYCNKYLSTLQASLPEFQKHGAQLVAISPEYSDKAFGTMYQNKLKFHVLSDLGLLVAKKYKIAFTLDEEKIAEYKGHGIDLQESNGAKTKDQLPLPVTYVIAPDGKIIYHFVDVDYTKRAEPAAIIKALEEYQAGQ